MIEYRLATSSDRDAILALRRRCFPDVDREKQSTRFAEWEFENSPDGAAAAMVAMEEDRCLSHIALIPRPAVFRGKTLRTALAVDAMTDPEARGRGLFSSVVNGIVESSRSRLDLIFAYQNRNSVLGAMLRNGWKTAARYSVVVRPVSLKGIISSGDDPLLAVREAGVQLLTKQDSALMSECAAGMTRNDVVSFPRSDRWIRWRCFERPDTRYRVTGIFSSKSLAAWLITRRATLRGIDTLAIVDVAFVDDRAARALIDDALAVASDHSVGLAAAFTSPSHPLHALVRRKHFFPSPYRFRQLIQAFGVTQEAAAEMWPVSWMDTDHL